MESSSQTIVTCPAGPARRDRRRVFALIWLPALVFGCQDAAQVAPPLSAQSPDADPATAGSGLASTAGAATTDPQPPAFRMLDAAADQELQEAFGIFRESRDAAREKYKAQRWRLTARIGDVAGDFAVVMPAHGPEIRLHFRSQAEIDRVEKGATYVLEATAEDWVSRHMIDGVMVEPAPPGG